MDAASICASFSCKSAFCGSFSRACSSLSAIRSFISVAAASVKVTIKISRSVVFSSGSINCFIQRSIKVRVLPVPAPATTRIFPLACIAFFCAGVCFMLLSHHWIHHSRQIQADATVASRDQCGKPMRNHIFGTESVGFADKE